MAVQPRGDRQPLMRSVRSAGTLIMRGSVRMLVLPIARLVSDGHTGHRSAINLHACAPLVADSSGLGLRKRKEKEKGKNSQK